MLRATARVHVPCDGRSPGRIIEAATVRGTLPKDAPLAIPTPARVSERAAPPALRALLQSGGRYVGQGLCKPGARTAGSALHAELVNPTKPQPPRDGQSPFENGFGALDPAGDYEIRVSGDHVPPAPWANVIANPRGGFLVSERGAGFTWAESSYFFRLTPWHNDPVSDPVSEVLYLRDEDTGEVWSATPAPIRNETSYTVVTGRAARRSSTSTPASPPPSSLAWPSTKPSSCRCFASPT